MQSYQLYIYLKKGTHIQVGKLGFFHFPKGNYVYVGSAKKNIEQRIKRHNSKNKKLHWHIDYLLNNVYAKIIKVNLESCTECELYNNTVGRVIISGFGSSDCKNRCYSHLKIFD